MSGKGGQMALKLDMSNAYDIVECAFLQAIIEKMNFPINWSLLVIECISSSSLSFLLNGRAICSVVPSRGLRQGCSLSPYIFLLCVEAFSCLVLNSEGNGRVLGNRCGKGSPFISHLFFTDDNILFYKASRDNGSRIQKSLVSMNGAQEGANKLAKIQDHFQPEC
ncbi:hypothetical protein Dsin_028018 [Dipteronia sinensis]|uniref:Reverse transcriptase domain-containing protein n=1 Tax=Dipteronia sinensis TaxID=43782 RepID=A0AAE0DV51_9ROSI|nr:hypothetical protein Dsin_028018 [Dipteronia sinensis]